MKRVLVGIAGLLIAWVAIPQANPGGPAYVPGVTQLVAGTGVSLSPVNGTGVVTVTASGGTGVTSVGLSIPGIFTITNSPVTTTGTLTATPAGTSGGIPYFSSATALASSGVLTANELVLGGGAGGTPTVVPSLGTTTTVLHGNAAGAPSFGAVALGTDVSGTLLAGQFPALTGDCTTSAGSLTTTCAAVNATTIPTNAAADQAIITTASATGAWKSLPNCTDTGGNHINYTTSTHAFSCGTTAGAATSVSTVTNPGAVSTNWGLGGGVIGQNATASSSNSVFIGALSGSNSNNALNGTGNVCVGQASCYSMTGAAASNTYMGNSVGQNTTSGSNNTFFGQQAGKQNSTGASNVMIGSAVGSATCATGNNNVLIGTTSNIDCASSSTASTIQIGAGSTAVWSATGTGTPSTSVTTIAGTETVTGALTLSAGETDTGGIINLNVSSNNAVNIGTGTTNSTVTIGGGSNAVTIAASAGNLTLSNVTTGTNADFVCMASGNKVTLQTSSCTISSKRFKENLLTVRSSVLPTISDMEVASFNMKPREVPNPDPNFGSRQIGLIAENIAQVSPECAIYENDMKTPKSYRQECVIALLVKGMQEQQAEIRDLRRQAKHWKR